MNPTSRIPWQGILAGIGAAVFYTTANVFLRKLATEIDPLVVVLMKALTTAVVVVPWLFAISRTRKNVIPSGKYFWIMVAAALQVQFFGNCGQQIAFGVIGLAISVPVYIGSLVASSALLGYWFLKENVSLSITAALSVLVFSVVVLSLGGEMASETVKKEQELPIANLPFYVGVLAAMGTGIAFAVLGVCIRYVLRTGVPAQTPMVFVSVTGVVVFGSIVFFRNGTGLFDQYDSLAWTTMVGAGVFNTAAFFCLSKSLNWLPVIYVNAINVSQVALAGVIGVWLFCEPLSVWLSAGLILMTVGFVALAHFTSTAVSKEKIETTTPAESSSRRKQNSNSDG